MKQVERIVQARNTRAFVDEDFELIVIRRTTEPEDDMGGTTQTTEELPPQRGRVIPSRSRSTSLTYTLPNGTIVSSKDSLLVGMPDLDVQDGDWFTWHGFPYRVTFVELDRNIQTLAQLDLIGETPRETL